VKLGAEPYAGSDKTVAVPAIKGIGGSLLYLSTATAPTVHPMTRNSIGSGSVIQSQKVLAFTISTI
jgi:4-hydroxyphenylpyruvate dioxygenase and related hemolysins